MKTIEEIIEVIKKSINTNYTVLESGNHIKNIYLIMNELINVIKEHENELNEIREDLETNDEYFEKLLEAHKEVFKNLFLNLEQLAILVEKIGGDFETKKKLVQEAQLIIVNSQKMILTVVEEEEEEEEDDEEEDDEEEEGVEE